MKLTRYWFEFAETADSPWRSSFGVTAWTYDDALAILKSNISDFHKLQLTKNVSDVDIRTLDADHVLPNIGNCAVRGFWFPQGYQ